MTKTNFITLAANAKKLFGQTFGLLTAVGPIGKTRQGNVIWLCACKCGNYTTIPGGDLVRRGPHSCGCRPGNYSHGMTGTSEYKIWKSMKGRCLNKNDAAYPGYGGRGITISNEWVNDFSQFYADMGPKPEGDYSIERADNDAGYCISNCSWQDRRTQNRNTRHNVMLTFDGKTMCVTEWSEHIGMTADVIYRRLYAGWDTEKALTQPICR